MRLVRYADKFDRLPIGNDGGIWRSLPVEWRPAAQPEARSQDGTTDRPAKLREEQQNPPTGEA